MISKKRAMIREISKRMFLREDVVEDVINEYINTMIVDTINNGEFNITNFFSIKSYEWSGYRQSHRETPIEDHWRLKVKLSKNLRLLYKTFGPNSENPNIINSQNWRKLLEIAKNNEMDKIKTEGFKESNKKDDNFNPFIDEEY